MSAYKFYDFTKFGLECNITTAAIRSWKIFWVVEVYDIKTEKIHNAENWYFRVFYSLLLIGARIRD